MAKADVVMEQKAVLVAAQDAAVEAALGACYDKGMEDAGAPAPVGFSQEQVDAFVAAAVEPMKAQIESIKAELADETAKEQTAEELAASLQQKLDAIKALL